MSIYPKMIAKREEEIDEILKTMMLREKSISDNKLLNESARTKVAQLSDEISVLKTKMKESK